MKDILIYKDFYGSAHYSTDDDVFYGKIEGINDLVTFEGKSVNELKQAFHDSVEDYIKICKETGKSIYKSYKGSFNVRIDPDIHLRAAQKALILGISLNQLIQKAIEKEVLKK